MAARRRFSRRATVTTLTYLITANMKHELPPLPYDHNALEPYVDARTMEIHHDKHHAAVEAFWYIVNWDRAERNYKGRANAWQVGA